jgi:hypothetical protein
MKISAKQLGEGVEVKVINKDSRITSIYQITERDAEKLNVDIWSALQELDRIRLIRQEKAETYMNQQTGE